MASALALGQNDDCHLYCSDRVDMLPEADRISLKVLKDRLLHTFNSLWYLHRSYISLLRSHTASSEFLHCDLRWIINCTELYSCLFQCRHCPLLGHCINQTIVFTLTRSTQPFNASPASHSIPSRLNIMPSNGNQYLSSSYSSRSSSAASGNKFPAQSSYRTSDLNIMFNPRKATDRLIEPTYTTSNTTSSRPQKPTIVYNNSTKYPNDKDIRSKYQDVGYFP